MKKTHTILAPYMLETQFDMLGEIMKSFGYKIEILKNRSEEVVQDGLMYVHNDTCYPALLVIGQMIHALKSGKYDPDTTALMITQTGGGCRASNYIHLLRKALVKAGFPQVPVISINLSGLEKNSGFSLSLPLIARIMACLVYGDVLMLLKNQITPYEVNKGETVKKVEEWKKRLSESLYANVHFSLSKVYENIDKIVSDFAAIEINKTPKVKVGVVGEIYVKYSSLGNNNLEEFLASQDCEVMLPGVMGFMLFKVDNRLEDIKLYGGNPFKKLVCTILFNFFKKFEKAMIDAFSKYPQFTPPMPYEHTKENVKGVIGHGNKMGEGWLLTGEMIDLVQMGYENIVCAQPFGCLPNHICGKGMVRKIRELYPEANIVPIDYDPSATRVNQENRIKLMLSIAKEKL
ncbi:MAG: 2-hydroxyacyl-CoA dehydratase [Clostridia bacterium]|nr:2-hydroxyacyl-CoA dehydratase [Clostridia bacterium]